MTDFTPLAEQIAREHRFVREGWSSSDCSCDPGGYTYGLAGFAAHIATVTEQAARERIAAEIEAALAEDTGWPADPEQIALTYRRAARIARGATP